MAMSKIVESNNLILDKTAFFLCDIQEKFKPAIDHFNEMVEVSQRLVSTTKILGIPLVVTEQYPKGLGKTVPELDISDAALVIDKTKFTMYSDEVKKFLEQKGIKTIVLFGVETHVCILQTAINLIENGYAVHLVADASSSRSQTDRLFALDRLRQLGCVVTTHESVIFQLVGDKNHEKFKEVQALVKNKSPDTGLLHRPSLI